MEKLSLTYALISRNSNSCFGTYSPDTSGDYHNSSDLDLAMCLQYSPTTLGMDISGFLLVPKAGASTTH
jgi:hypothetical protein